VKNIHHYRILIFCVVISILCSGAWAVDQSMMTQEFYGTVETAGSPAETGILIEAKGAGVLTGTDGNPIPVTVAGSYGGPGYDDRKLIVEGSIVPGSPLEFYVQGIRAEVSTDKAIWTAIFPFSSGSTTQLHLRISDFLTLGELKPENITIPTSTYLSYSGGGGGYGGTGGSSSSSTSANTGTVTATQAPVVEGTTQPGTMESDIQSHEPNPSAPQQANLVNEPGQSGQPWTIFGIPGIWIAGFIGLIVIVNVSVILGIKWGQGRE